MNIALQYARGKLLAELRPDGRWEGGLSSSALATAVASFALKLAGNPELAERGFEWLRTHQNADGGWGERPESPSNFTTTLLCRCVLDKPVGSTQEVARSILDHYGDDRTFSVPILTMCMLTGKPFSEKKLLQAGYAIEQALGRFVSPVAADLGTDEKTNGGAVA